MLWQKKVDLCTQSDESEKRLEYCPDIAAVSYYRNGDQFVGKNVFQQIQKISIAHYVLHLSFGHF